MVHLSEADFSQRDEILFKKQSRKTWKPSPEMEHNKAGGQENTAAAEMRFAAG